MQLLTPEMLIKVNVSSPEAPKEVAKDPWELIFKKDPRPRSVPLFIDLARQE